MSLSNEQILDAIAEMSVIDVVALVRSMEERFGVSAAAAVAAPLAPGQGVDQDDSPVEEQTEFTVKLTSFGEKKINVIKEIKAITGIGLKESKELVEKADESPVVQENLDKESADKIRTRLEAAGATVEIV